MRYTSSRRKTRFRRFRRKTVPGGKRYRNPSGKGMSPQYTNVRLGQGFPKRILVTHRYRETVSSTSTAGGIGNYVFRANSLFDPNLTGVGHQPMYKDQMALIYNYYTVIGSKITVRATQSGVTNVAATVSIYVDSDSTVTNSDIDNICELPTAKNVVLPAGSSDSKILTHSWSMKRWFGRHANVGDSLFRADANSNPTDVTNFIISTQAVDRSTSNSVNYEVLIEYIAVWGDPIDVAGS